MLCYHIFPWPYLCFVIIFFTGLIFALLSYFSLALSLLPVSVLFLSSPHASLPIPQAEGESETKHAAQSASTIFCYIFRIHD
jgi:hypothetical protein